MYVGDGRRMNTEVCEGRKPVHEYVDDFMNCKKKEDCRDCACQKNGDFYICLLLQHYKDKLIEKIYEIT